MHFYFQINNEPWDYNLGNAEVVGFVETSKAQLWDTCFYEKGLQSFPKKALSSIPPTQLFLPYFLLYTFK